MNGDGVMAGGRENIWEFCKWRGSRPGMVEKYFRWKNVDKEDRQWRRNKGREQK